MEIMRKKDYYWDNNSEILGKILRSEFTYDMSICEIGFSGGHFLEYLYDIGYRKLHGIEIREEQFRQTQKKFRAKGLEIELICGDATELFDKYDGIFCTGLIQCLDTNQRVKFLDHVSSISNIAIFTVPEILEDRNMESNQKVAVTGCKEYKTGDIPYELANYYDNVRVGRIDKSRIHLEDTFIYYICRKKSQ